MCVVVCVSHCFVAAHNRHDWVLVSGSIATIASDSNLETKIRIAALMGVSMPMRLTWSGLEPRGLRVMRLLRLENKDFSAFAVARVLRGAVVSNQNELSVAKSMFEMCATLLRQYDVVTPNNLEQTDDAIETQRMLAITVDGERSLLKSCLKQVSGVAE